MCPKDIEELTWFGFTHLTNFFYFMVFSFSVTFFIYLVRWSTLLLALELCVLTDCSRSTLNRDNNLLAASAGSVSTEQSLSWTGPIIEESSASILFQLAAIGSRLAKLRWRTPSNHQYVLMLSLNLYSLLTASQGTAYSHLLQQICTLTSA